MVTKSKERKSIIIDNINKSGVFVYHTAYRIYKKKDYFECRLTGDYICNLVEYLSANRTLLFGDTELRLNVRSVVIRNSNYFKLCIDTNLLLSIDYNEYYTDIESINTYQIFNLYCIHDYKTIIEKAIIKYAGLSKKRDILKIISNENILNKVELIDSEKGKYIITNNKPILKLVIAAFIRLSAYVDDDHTSPYFINKNKSGFSIEQDLELCYRYLNGLFRKELKGDLHD